MSTKQLLSKKNVGILVIIIGAVVVLSFVNQKKTAPIAEKQGECLELRGTGKQTYEARTDNPKTLEIVQIEVDPIDVKQGETQKITVKVKDKGNNTITNKSGVSADIFTDNKITAIASSAFKLALAGDEQNNGASLITTWEGSWTRDDDYCLTYMQTITATNNKGDTASVDLSLK